jgi:hypothetical protein
MATLPRPGVEISQEIIVQSPTVLNPTLVPCLVGPCYQIVKPITEDGSLDSTAQVTVAAVLESDDVLAEELNLSGKFMLINVNGNGFETISFPVTLNGASISHELTVNTLNKQLPSGAVAAIVDGKLRISTTASGPTASLELGEVVDGLGNPDPTHSAYGPANDIVNMDHLQGKKISGQSVYTNLSYTVPYTSFPSPMTDVSEVVITDSATVMYRYFDSILSEISENSATNVNSYHQSNTKVAGEWVGPSHQPALGNGQTKLWAKPVSGSSTNKVLHMGTNASLIVPLGHTVDPHGNVDTALPMWPDPTGGNYIEVKALGLDPYFVDGDASQVKNAGLIGVGGNDLAIHVKEKAGDPVVTYVPGSLTIELNKTTTVAALESAIATSKTTWEDEISITLATTAADPATAKALSFVNSAANLIQDLAGGGAAWSAQGGSDPVDFTADAIDDPNTGDDHRKAWVCGSMPCTNATTGDDLGIGGQSLTLTIDGTATEITIPTDSSIVTAVNDALTAGGLGAATATTLKNMFGETVQVLQISSASQNGHDSTIEVSGDDAVIKNLLSGTTSGSDTGVTGIAQEWAGGGGNAGRGVLIEPADYNTAAVAACENAILPGSLKVDLSGITLMSAIRVDAVDLTHGGAGDGANDLIIDIDGANTKIQDITVPVGAWATVKAVADELNTEFANAGVDADVQAAAMGGDDLVIWSPSGKTLKIYSNGDGAQAAGTTSAGINATLGGDAAACWFLDGVVAADRPASSEATGITMTIRDSDDVPRHGLQVHTVSNNMANVINPPDATSAAELTSWILGGNNGNAGLAESFVDYSGGTVKIVFAGDSEAVVVKDATCPVAESGGGTSAAITYTRMWPNPLGASAPLYTARMFHGQSNETLPADFLKNNGSVLGRVVDIGSLSVQDKTFNGSVLTYSEFALDKTDTIDAWYITAENLVSGDVDQPRVEPEATGDDLAQKYTIKPALLRNKAGICITNSQAPVYVDYKALRKDVSADTANPGLLVFNSVSEVEALIGPVDPSNPLAFGLYLAFLNTSGINISALGVSETSPDAPNGTLEGYAEALEYLQLKEVYALAPLTDDMEVFKKVNLHVTDMSKALAKKERMALVCPSLPTEKNSELVASADLKIKDIGGGKYSLTIADEAVAAQINLPMSLNGKIDANGSTIAAANGAQFTPDAGIYIDRAGDAHRYLVVATPSSDTVVIDTNPGFQPGFGPGSGGNDDSYYRTGTDAIANLETFEADGELCTLYVRQVAIDTSTTAGKLAACETLAEWAGGVTGFQNRRMVMVQPEQVGVTSGGLEIVVPGHYLCAGIAAMIGQQNPSQPFTNLPMVGYTQPVGSNDKFSENQMATAAAGGIYWVIQDVEGAPLVSRHQLTTDVSSLKTREMSILKAVDYVAKLIRNQTKRFIGKNNITKQLLDAISLGISAALTSVAGSVVASATLDKIVVDKQNPDSVLVELSVIPFYPANRIKITIFI